MKTSCFKKYTGKNGVAICLYPPRNWTGVCFFPLAPDKQTFNNIKAGKITETEYEQLYIKNILSKLDIKEVYEKFKDSVLLCYENPGEFCHRRIVAKYIEDKLGIIVPEWNIKDEEIKTNSKSLF